MNAFHMSSIFRNFVSVSKNFRSGFRFLSSDGRRLPKRKNRVASSEPSSVSLYLGRAKLIDSLRLLLRNPDGVDEAAIRRYGPQINPFVASQVIRGCPSPETAVSFFKLLGTIPGFAHTQNTVHSLAKRLSNAAAAEELGSLIRAIDSGEFDGVSASFMDLLRWHSGTGDLNAAVNVWMRMKFFYEKEFSSKRPCTESYNILLNLYAEKGKHVEATNLFLYMVKQGAIPNPRTYTVIMTHLVMFGKLGEAMEIFKRLPAMRIRRTSKQYILLIDAFSSSGDAEIVRNLTDEMRKDGILPGRALISAVKLLRESGFLGEAEEISKEFLPDSRIGNIAPELNFQNETFDHEDIGFDGDSENENEVDEYNPGVSDGGMKLKPWIDPIALASCLKNWNSEDVSALEDAKFVWTTRLACKVLRGFKRVDTAWEFFCWVAKQPGFTHDISTVSRMIVMLARQGNFDLVDRLVLKVKSEGIQLSISTVRLIIDAYGISKNADAACKVFQNLTSSKYGLKPSLFLYSSLIRTLTKSGRAHGALDILEEMMLIGIGPDLQTLSGLMQHFSNEGDVRKVEELFGMIKQSGIEPDAYTYSILINAYCKNERSALAMRVFDDMVTAGLMPEASTKSLLVRSLWKEGKLREAASIEERIPDTKGVLPRALLGHIWSVSFSDLMHVYHIYVKCFA